VAFHFEERRGELCPTEDATTGVLKRWETPRGKLMAVIEDSALVLTKIGRQMGYKVSNKELFKT